MFTFKIETEPNLEWNQNLLKSADANFFQSVEYLSSSSKEFFPVFVSILDENKNIVAQYKVIIIKSTVLYSSPLLQLFLNLIQQITKRGIWRDGPVIHSSGKEERIQILQTIIKANNEICKKYDLVILEGYVSPYDPLVDDNYIQQFVNDGYRVRNSITYILDMSKPIEEIWKNVSRKARGDVNRAKRRNIIATELHSYDELKEYLLLHNAWAKTKGLELADPFRDIEEIWRNHNKGNEKFFLAYQDGELISALRIACFNGIAYANFVISSYSESTNLGGTLLTWTSLEWAKNTGIRLYDFSGGVKSDDNTQNNNTLLFYKKKWGGDEHLHYNLIKIPKKYHHMLYKLLFGLIRYYHNFKGRRYKTMIKRDYDEPESDAE